MLLLPGSIVLSSPFEDKRAREIQPVRRISFTSPFDCLETKEVISEVVTTSQAKTLCVGALCRANI